MPTTVIAIGNHFGGPEHRGSAIHSTLNRAMNIAAENRDAQYDDGTEAWINPIYIVPGSISKPDFDGYKLGHFSRKKKGLVVMIAVPEQVAEGQDMAGFVAASLREAVRLGAAHFSAKGIGFSALRAEQIILAVEAGLRDVR